MANTAGHKTRSIFDRYNIVSGQDLREAAAKMNKALGSRTGRIRRFPPSLGARDSSGPLVGKVRCRRTEWTRHDLAVTGF